MREIIPASRVFASRETLGRIDGRTGLCYTWLVKESQTNEMGDAHAAEVFVFTPEGEAKSLRAGATPVDFAYSVHTQVGHHCVGAKVDGSIVPLTYELKTGERVEILTQKSATPSRDWLNFVKTPSAKSKIRQYFSKQSRPDDLQAGRDILIAEMKKHGMGLSSVQMTRSIKELAGKLNFKNADELLIKSWMI